MIHRRHALLGFGAALFAPAVIRTPGLLMPLKVAPVVPLGPPSVFSGSDAPSRSLGRDGDLYLDYATGRLHGPKRGGSWGAAVPTLYGIHWPGSA